MRPLASSPEVPQIRYSDNACPGRFSYIEVAFLVIQPGNGTGHLVSPRACLGRGKPNPQRLPVIGKLMDQVRCSFWRAKLNRQYFVFISGNILRQIARLHGKRQFTWQKVPGVVGALRQD
jgi:hypothetical protein